MVYDRGQGKNSAIPEKVILCFYSEEKATILLNRHIKHFIIDCSKDPVEQMDDPKRFFRTNRRFLTIFML
ncbi:hypothetical protein [Nafulsella turpanensis]|uniref:hypothetical protein n=1 Tax=Nafulsella turpanensis TaxID=1265690 RepID=UPI0003473D34|nr:hypothetical protein [Nafulsella turpanensis]